MNQLAAVFKREYASFFRTPLGWVVCALFLFLSGLVFARSVLVPGEVASLREFFTLWWSLLAVIAPAVSMRLVADELRTGTIEPLLCSPAGELTIAVGKFGAAAAFLATCLVPTLVYPAILMLVSRPDAGPMLAGYLGVLLLGWLYLAVGLLLSSLTASQTLAFLGTLFVILSAELGAQQLAIRLPAPYDAAALKLSVSLRIGDFARGIIDTRHVVFMVVLCGFFVACTALVLKARRWR
jgi:ABC-2 type transport system permease protein